MGDPQARNITVSLGSAATAFVGTVWGKVVAILAAISLIMGIALEVQSFIRGNYELETAKNNAAMTGAEAAAKTAMKIDTRTVLPVEPVIPLEPLRSPQREQATSPAPAATAGETDGERCVRRLRRLEAAADANGWDDARTPTPPAPYTAAAGDACLSNERQH